MAISSVSEVSLVGTMESKSPHLILQYVIEYLTVYWCILEAIAHDCFTGLIEHAAQGDRDRNINRLCLWDTIKVPVGPWLRLQQSKGVQSTGETSGSNTCLSSFLKPRKTCGAGEGLGTAAYGVPWTSWWGLQVPEDTHGNLRKSKGNGTQSWLLCAETSEGGPINGPWACTQQVHGSGTLSGLMGWTLNVTLKAGFVGMF